MRRWFAGLKPRATGVSAFGPIVAGLMAFVIASGSPAFAQTHPTSGVFVHGGVFASIERRPHSEVESNVIIEQTFGDASGTVLGGAFGVGGFLTPRLTARLEVALPAALDEEAEQTISLITESSRSEVRLRDVYVLLGYETDPTRRVRLSYLAGAVIRQERIDRELTIGGPSFLPVIPPVVIPPIIQRIEQSSVSYGTSVTFGLDATAMLTERAALVPQVRVVAAGGGLSVRPGVSLRWNF